MATPIHSAPSVLVLCLVACCVGSRPALSATASASFGVSMTVEASCQASFGTDRAASPGAISPVSVVCNHPVPYYVSVGMEQSIRRTLPALETQGLGPAGARFGPLPTFASSANWDRAGSNFVAGTDRRSAQALTVHGGTVGSQHPASPANPERIFVTVIY